jgi:hypothetical protein
VMSECSANVSGRRRSPERSPNLGTIWEQYAQTPGKTGEQGRPESRTNQQDRRSGPVCKTSIPGSNPGGASNPKHLRSTSCSRWPSASILLVAAFWPEVLPRRSREPPAHATIELSGGRRRFIEIQTPAGKGALRSHQRQNRSRGREERMRSQGSTYRPPNSKNSA